MTTPTMEKLNGLQARAEGLAAASAHQKEAMAALLEQKTASASIGSRLASLPRRAAARLRSALKAFKLDALANGLTAAWARLRSFAGGLLGKLSMVGYGTIAGVILTAGGLRHQAVRLAAKAYRVITTPLRWIGSGLRMLGLGKVVDFFSRATVKVETFVANQTDKVLTWLDAHENSGAMRWGRTIFQATLIQRALRLVFPWASGTWVFFASLFVPTFGTQRAAIASENAAIKRAADKLRTAGDKAADAAAAAVQVPTAKVEEAPVAQEFVRNVKTNALYQVIRFTDPEGVEWVKVEGTLLDPMDLPDDYELGTVVGEATDAEIEAAIARQKGELETIAKASSVTDLPVAGTRDNRRLAAKGNRKR